MRQWTEIAFSYEQLTDCLRQVMGTYSAGMLLERPGKSGWKYRLIAGLGVNESCVDTTPNSLDKLKTFTSGKQDFIFGHLGYGLKSETENVHDRFPNEDGFGSLFFFIPEIVVLLEESGCLIGYLNETDYRTFLSRINASRENDYLQTPVAFHVVTPKEQYLRNAQSILGRIHRGDIYEMNYCISFEGNSNAIDPIATYSGLRDRTSAPYGGLYHCQDSWLLCGSPELYLKKTGGLIESEPIKGTRRRAAHPQEDRALQEDLHNDGKERSENVMIVDLVRNDLSRVCMPGSVTVPELFKITSHKTVHQMSSRITGRLNEGAEFCDVISATFPMGSMTGAPKISAMRIADEFEDRSRGIYSGSIGYLEPDGDFEFNVVIRSITWNTITGHVAIKAGSALTAKCDPVKEHEECCLKAEAMMDALKSV